MANKDTESKIVDTAKLSTEKMDKYGITCVPVDYFYFRNYRYTNLDDAIAQANREATE